MYDGRTKVFTATIPSGTTSSAEVDLGGYYKRIILHVPSGVSNADTRVYFATESGGTFQPAYVGYPDNNTSTPAVFNIASSISNIAIAVPANGRFMKVVGTGAISDGAIYKVVCQA